MIVRNLGRVSLAALTAVLLLAGSAPNRCHHAAAAAGFRRREPRAPGPGGGRGGPQPPKNIQVLKDVPLDELQLTMQYIAASLGVQCTYCHVQGQNDSDDKDTKKRAREMMAMVQDINGKFFDGTQRLSCASCHNGRPKPLRTPPLAVDMTPAEAAVAAAGRGRGGGRGGPGGPGGAPGGAAVRARQAGESLQERRRRPGPEGRGGPGRGGGPQEPRPGCRPRRPTR